MHFSSLRFSPRFYFSGAQNHFNVKNIEKIKNKTQTIFSTFFYDICRLWKRSNSCIGDPSTSAPTFFATTIITKTTKTKTGQREICICNFFELIRFKQLLGRYLRRHVFQFSVLQHETYLLAFPPLPVNPVNTHMPIWRQVLIWSGFFFDGRLSTYHLWKITWAGLSLTDVLMSPMMGLKKSLLQQA